MDIVELDDTILTKERYKYYIKKFVKEEIWQSPYEDEQYILELPRLTRRGGDIGESLVFGEYYDLPEENTYFHLFMLGSNHPDKFNFKYDAHCWYEMTKWCEEGDMTFRMYNRYGVQIPLSWIYFMIEPDKNILLAVKCDIELPGFDLNQDNVYIHIRSGQYWVTDEVTPEQYRIRIQSSRIDTISEKNTIESNTLHWANWDNFEPRSEKLYWQPAFGTKLMNGKLVSDFQTGVRGDTIDTIEDGSTEEVHWFRIFDLPTFHSDLDKQNKYYVQLYDYDLSTDEAYEHNRTITYRDDIEIYLVKLDYEESNRAQTYLKEHPRGPLYGSMIDIEKQIRYQSGYWYPRNKEDSVRMVTHRGYSLPVDYVQYIVRHYDETLDLGNWYLRVLVKRDGFMKKIGLDRTQLDALQDLEYIERIDAITGTESTIDFWRAENLEKNPFNFIMRALEHEIDAEIAYKAIGHNSAAKAVANPNISITKDNDQSYFVLPVGLIDKSTVFEYDRDGLLLGYYHHEGSTRYLPSNQECVFIESLVGHGKPQGSYFVNQRNVPKKPMVNYRFYLMNLVNGVPYGGLSDVTLASRDNGTPYVVESERQFTVDVNPDDEIIFGVSDEDFLLNEVRLDGKDDGIFQFIVTYGEGYPNPVLVPPKTIDVWVNGRALVEDIDFIVDFPYVTIVSRTRLNVKKEESVIVTYRCQGFPELVNNKFQHRKPYDNGYVYRSSISVDNRYDVHRSRLQRIIVDGYVKNPYRLHVNQVSSEIHVNATEDGAPYSFGEHFIPLRAFAGNKEAYLLQEEDEKRVKQVEDFVTHRNFPPEKPSITSLRKHYQLYSPFMAALINDIFLGTDEETLSHYLINVNYRSKSAIDELAKPYKHLLKSDPAYYGSDIDYVDIHPLPYQFEDKITVHHRTLSILKAVAKQYLKADLHLEEWFKVKRTRITRED